MGRRPRQGETRDVPADRRAGGDPRSIPTGGDMVVEAGAGGKSATFAATGESDPGMCVSNIRPSTKAMVTEATERMPANTTCNTVHSLPSARRHPFARRLNLPGCPAANLCEAWCDRSKDRGEVAERRLPGSLATRWRCGSARPGPGAGRTSHPLRRWNRRARERQEGWRHNRQLRAYLAPFMAKVWKTRPTSTGNCRTANDFYVKPRSAPGMHIAADVVAIDERRTSRGVQFHR